MTTALRGGQRISFPSFGAFERIENPPSSVAVALVANFLLFAGFGGKVGGPLVQWGVDSCRDVLDVSAWGAFQFDEAALAGNGIQPFLQRKKYFLSSNQIRKTSSAWGVGDRRRACSNFRRFRHPGGISIW